MTLPAWLEPLPDAAAMRATDAWAIEQRGVPGLELMERAATALADAVVFEPGPVAIVCGTGNNGGDGFAAARILSGRDVRVLLVGERERVRGDALVNLERLPGGVTPFSPVELEGCPLVVDCLLGTGASGEPRGAVAEAIAALDGRRVVSCDVPSGVDASTGEVAGVAVRAERTITFHAAKPGLWIAPGKAHAGEVVVADIGIPDGAPVAVAAGLITRDVVGEHPPRQTSGTKFASGHVLVAGGSRGLTGAPTLAALGAMRAGAGYVTVCVPASLEAIFEIKLTEAMTAALPEDDATAAAAAVLERAGRGGALVLGPGLGRSEHAVAFARHVAAGAPVALVLDADGLNAHAASNVAERSSDDRSATFDGLAAREAPTVLTPHAGELGRLLGVDSAEVERRRLHHARAAARRARAIVVLKGDDTIVADPSGRAAVSRGGSPALATAGTGDVLSGVVAAFVARGMEPFTAACAAVTVHAEAGRLAAGEVGVEGVIASDVAHRVGRVIADRR